MIRILLVDDQNLVQQGIKSLLDQDPQFQVIDTVTDGRSAIIQVNNLRPDIVLLDIEMPGMDGITATKYIAQLAPQTKVIILSSHEDKKHLTQALMAGAKAYILKSSLTRDLKQSIISVNNGYSHIESRLLAKIFDPSNLKRQKTKRKPKQVADADKITNNIPVPPPTNVVEQTLPESPEKTAEVPLADAVVLKHTVETTDSSTVKQNIQSASDPADLQSTDIVPLNNSASSLIVESEDSRQKADRVEKTRENIAKQLFPPTFIGHGTNNVENARKKITQQLFSQTTLGRSTSQPSTVRSNVKQSFLVAVSDTRQQLGKNYSKINQYKQQLVDLWTAKKRQFRPLMRRYQKKLTQYKSKLSPLLKQWYQKGWLTNLGLGFLGLIIVIMIHQIFF